MKKLLSKLGSAGVVIYWIIAVILFVMPLAILGLPWWANIIISGIMLGIPLVGEVVEFAVYVWALVEAVKQPFDWAFLLFYISLALYIISTLIPSIIDFISSASQKAKNYDK